MSPRPGSLLGELYDEARAACVRAERLLAASRAGLSSAEAMLAESEAAERRARAIHHLARSGATPDTEEANAKYIRALADAAHGGDEQAARKLAQLDLSRPRYLRAALRVESNPGPVPAPGAGPARLEVVR